MSLFSATLHRFKRRRVLYVSFLGLGLFVWGSCLKEDKDKPTSAGQRKPSSQQVAGQKALRSLPYLNWVPVKKEDRGKKGVVRYFQGRAYKGVNFYASCPRHQALLTDMQGEVLHSWSSSFGEPTPKEKKWTTLFPSFFGGWQYAALGDNGEALAIVFYHSLIKLDRNSEVLWTAPVHAHHEITLDDNGDILTLSAERLPLHRQGQPLLILDDHIVTLSPLGKVKKRRSIFELLGQDKELSARIEQKLALLALHFKTHFLWHQLNLRSRFSEGDLKKMAATAAAIFTNRSQESPRVQLLFLMQVLHLDIFHTNAVEILQEAKKGLWKKGDLLVSVRDLDLLVVFDRHSGRIRWRFGPGILEQPHNPTLLDNGNILIFDNGTRSKRSRVIEVDPQSKRIVWTYQGSPEHPFFSEVRGGCQKLKNGNVLITDSERGRVFEVDRAGEIVWEFYNPDLDDSGKGKSRAPIYRMRRIPEEKVDWKRTNK